MKRTILTVVFTLLAVFVIGAIVSCSAKEQGRWNAGTNVRIDNLPSDVCMVGGRPQIINANTESNGGFSLVYVDKSGNVVIAAWPNNPIVSWVLQPAGRYYWTGAICPSQ